jgi:phenylacetate-CoA ligase
VIDPRDNQIPRKIADRLHFYRKVVIDLKGADPIGALHARRPEVIMSWPTVLSEMAPAWAERKTASSRSPKFVISGGETLTEVRRERISKGFGARVFDMLGAHEFSLVAWECPVSGDYHLSDETLFGEVISDGKRVAPGERGELVATNLHSWAMPFIRYKLGDLVTQGTTPCACGSPFSSIRGISGRVVDLIPLSGGRKVHPQDISRESFIAAPVIRGLQVVQHALDRIDLHIIPYREPTPDEIAGIHRAMEKWIGPGVTFNVVVVSEIERPPEGKFRVYRSTMAKAD